MKFAMGSTSDWETQVRQARVSLCIPALFYKLLLTIASADPATMLDFEIQVEDPVRDTNGAQCFSKEIHYLE